MTKKFSRMESRFVTVTKYFILVLMSLVVLFPLYFVLVSSFKSDTDIFLSPFSLPSSLDLSNYKYVFIDMSLWRYMVNSLYYAVTSVLLILIVSTMCAYAIARMYWKFKSIALLIIMTGMLIPMHAIIFPLYISVRKMGFVSPWFVLVLVYVAFAIPKSIFILVNFLKGIPRSLEEAAIIDGASIFRVIVQIIVPLLKPAISVIVVFDFLSIWNDLLISLVFISDKLDRTLQMGVMMFKGDYVTNYNMIMIAVVCSILPTIVIYFIFQKRIIAGLTSGAVKE